MICVFCGKRIEDSGKEGQGRRVHDSCSHLWHSWHGGLRDKFCCECGTVIPKISGRNGHLNNSVSDFCPHCKIVNKMKKDMEHLKKKRELSPNLPTRKGYENKYRYNWRKRNSQKEWAAVTARMNTDNLTILYECSCNNGSPKEKHHHDYTKPLEVMLLCHACHMKWHSRIRNQSSPALPDKTAQVIDTGIGCGGQAGDQTQ